MNMNIYYILFTMIFYEYINSLFSENKNQNQNQIGKKNVVLLGDGFFARGFLHHINYNKFFITQLYKEPFMNPQDIMYSLQRNQKYDGSLHIRDFSLKRKSPDNKIQMNIKSLDITTSSSEINIKNMNNESKKFEYDNLVIGLGSQKSLGEWNNEINSFVGEKNKSIAIVGMGPTGIELATILSKYNTVKIHDILPYEKTFMYVSSKYKNFLIEHLNKNNIQLNFGKPYVQYKAARTQNNELMPVPAPVDDRVIFCVGNKPNHLIDQNIKINNFLETTFNNKIYIGGDCINSGYIKTAQVAYQQGVYVAKRLNGDIPPEQTFEYKSNGILMNIGDNKVLIEGHNIVPNGVYPDFITRLYSMFCI